MRKKKCRHFGLICLEYSMFQVAKLQPTLNAGLEGGGGFADLFWKEVLLVEQKGRGKDLDVAKEQALRYCDHISGEDMPRYIIACDFQRFVMDDLDKGVTHRFLLAELPDKIKLFSFIQGKIIPDVKEDPVNRNASIIMAKISNALSELGYDKKDLGYFLTRLTYCMFADDTEIFEKNLFQNYVINMTARDGNDVGIKIKRIFEVLNTPNNERQETHGEILNKFPYIDGDLFKGDIKTPEFNSDLRALLIEASKFDWSKVSPAIFGNLFQGVMSAEARRDEGAHYTTEKNILKVINPLFMDALEAEYRKIKSRQNPQRRIMLKQFQIKLSKLKLFDPACGSGNFLIISYREIRRLELSIIRELHDPSKQLLDVSKLSKVNVDQFYGIEIDEISVKIAEAALWMMDHLMNRELGSTYGLTYARIPLKKHPRIICKDALDYDWNKLLDSSKCSYLLGNPPYSGSKKQTKKNRVQIERLAGKGKKDLDYVAGWFIKASRYISSNTEVGFVATNSITQGEQVGLLWPMLNRERLEISFAHRPFQWGSDAQGMARVAVVIIGLSKNKYREKRLIDENDEGTTIQEYHKFISPYLIGSNNKLPIVMASNACISNLPRMMFGTQPIDGKHYIFSDSDKRLFVENEPGSEKYFRMYVSAKDLIDGVNRWILDLEDAKPSDLKLLPHVSQKINDVIDYRMKSSRKETRKLAQTPREFAHRPKLSGKKFIVIPSTSSEKREYVPITILPASCIASNANMIVDSDDVGLFGLLISKMHMTWLRLVGGRLESRLRYSESVVYNTFPTPDKIVNLHLHAQHILDIRQKYNDHSLKELYDAATMPGDLLRAHRKLDSAVDRLYRKKNFETVHERMEYLLQKYGSSNKPDYQLL